MLEKNIDIICTSIYISKKYVKLNRDPSDPILKTKTRTETIIAPCSPTCIRILTCGKRRPRAPSRF